MYGPSVGTADFTFEARVMRTGDGLGEAAYGFIFGASSPSQGDSAEWGVADLTDQVQTAARSSAQRHVSFMSGRAVVERAETRPPRPACARDRVEVVSTLLPPAAQVPTVEGVGSGDPGSPSDGGGWWCTNAPWAQAWAQCSSTGWPAASSPATGSVPIYSCWRPNYIYCNGMSAMQPLPLNTWVSLKLSRCGNAVTFWVDGTLQFQFVTPTPGYRWSPATLAGQRVPYRVGSLPTGCAPEEAGGCTGATKVFAGQIAGATLTFDGCSSEGAGSPPPPPPPPPPSPPPPSPPLSGPFWSLVRRVVGAAWHPATDDFSGTAVYGTAACGCASAPTLYAHCPPASLLHGAPPRCCSPPP